MLVNREIRLLTYLLTYLLHGAESFVRRKPVLSWSRNSPHYMQPDGSLPLLQVPATCPHPEPAQFIPWPNPTQFLQIYLNIILPFRPGSSTYFRKYFGHEFWLQRGSSGGSMCSHTNCFSAAGNRCVPTIQRLTLYNRRCCHISQSASSHHTVNVIYKWWWLERHSTLPYDNMAT